MAVRRFQDLFAWRLSRELERRVFAFTATSPAQSDGDFCRQIRRSSSSAPRNIAEGFGRFWPGEFAHKVRIALGELRETQDHLGKALEQQYATESELREMGRLADRAIGACTRLVQYLDRAGPDWKKGFLAARRRGYENPNREPESENLEPERENFEPENPKPKNPKPKNQNPEP